MVEIIPYSDDREAEALALMMKCIREVKKRKFDPTYDKDMLDLAAFYDIREESALFLAQNRRKEIVGTLGLKSEGIIDENKTGMLKRLYVQPGFRGESWYPLLNAVTAHVKNNKFERIRFVTRARFGQAFRFIQAIAPRFGLKTADIQDGEICTIDVKGTFAKTLATLM